MVQGFGCEVSKKHYGYRETNIFSYTDFSELDQSSSPFMTRVMCLWNLLKYLSIRERNLEQVCVLDYLLFLGSCCGWCTSHFGSSGLRGTHAVYQLLKDNIYGLLLFTDFVYMKFCMDMPFCSSELLRYLDMTLVKDTLMYYAFNTMLLMLLVFHMYWWYLICAMIIRQLENRGKVGEDIRSGISD